MNAQPITIGTYRTRGGATAQVTHKDRDLLNRPCWYGTIGGRPASWRLDGTSLDDNHNRDLVAHISSMQPYKQPRMITFLGYVALLAGVLSILWAIVHMMLHLV